VEVEFSFTDSSYPFVAATETTDCVVELAELVPRDGDRYAEFFNIIGADPETGFDLTASYETLDVNLLEEHTDGGLFEFTATGDCPAYSLAERGALPREATAVDDEGLVVAQVPPQYDASEIIADFRQENPGAELVSKQTQDSFSPIITNSLLQDVLRSHLTARQREVLQTAYESGYYEWPRECTGKDVATELGISSATFSEHIQAAERKLVATKTAPSAMIGGIVSAWNP
jgi:predicted DNA binding protein